MTIQHTLFNSLIHMMYFLWTILVCLSTNQLVTNLCKCKSDCHLMVKGFSKGALKESVILVLNLAYTMAQETIRASPAGRPIGSWPFRHGPHGHADRPRILQRSDPNRPTHLPRPTRSPKIGKPMRRQSRCPHVSARAERGPAWQRPKDLLPLGIDRSRLALN
jgi:hypothetical protein